MTITTLAREMGTNDGNTFVNDNHTSEVALFLRNREQPDEALINAMGADAAAEAFGLSRDGTARFAACCRAYNRAFRRALRRSR